MCLPGIRSVFRTIVCTRAHELVVHLETSHCGCGVVNGQAHVHVDKAPSGGRCTHAKVDGHLVVLDDMARGRKIQQSLHPVGRRCLRGAELNE
jgi:hypothetical protein